MSCILKRGSRYYLQFTDSDRSPTNKQFSLRTSKKKSVVQLQAELEDLYLRGLFDAWTDDFREDLEKTKRPNKPTEVDPEGGQKRFLQSKEGLSDSTYRMYELVTRLFREHVGDQKFQDLTLEDVRSFLQSGDRSLKSQHTYLRHLKVFVRWCGKRGWLRDLVILGVFTGLRRAELSRLQWRHVSLEAKEIFVEGQTKSGKHRTVPLSTQPMICLGEKEHREEGDHVLHLGNPKRPIHVDTLTHEFLQLRRDVHPGKKDHSLHSLRHTFCTLLAEAGTPTHTIKQLAGHASIDTTMKYVHSLSGSRSNISAAFDG
jgi:integrase